MNEMEIEGEAHLCFPVNETWFQGYLMTLDNCQFTIFGSKCEKDKSEQNGFNHHNGDGDQLLLTTRKNNVDECSESGEDDCLCSLTIFDHEQAMEYVLDRVVCSLGSQICSLHSKQIQFKADCVYKGQKATMLVQNMLPKLVEKNLQVYAGHMKISIDQKQRPLIPYPTWIL